jgi:hypothetical protein
MEAIAREPKVDVKVSEFGFKEQVRAVARPKTASGSFGAMSRLSTASAYSGPPSSSASRSSAQRASFSAKLMRACAGLVEGRER